jgi:glycosyltransferase involved in cell wall biosynthesis
MHIHLLIPGIYKTQEDLQISELASIRFRAAIIAKYLPQHGSTVSFGETIPETSNIIMVGKIGVNDIEKRQELWLNQMKSAKNKNIKIFIDYTDHHLDPGFKSKMRIFYESSLKLTDYIITPSDHLKILLKNYFSKEIFVIPDPLEVPVLSPKISKTNGILWFGHASNIVYLINFLEECPKTHEVFKLIVVSNDVGLNILAKHRFQNKIRFKVSLQRWSLKTLIEASKISDICIIPSDRNDPKKSGVSSNRLITSIALGLPTVAEIMPSYAEFSKYFFNIRSNSLLETMSNSSSSEFRKLISEAQQKIIPKFLPRVMAQQWIELFKNF